MSNEITVKHTGPGAGYTKEIEAEELAEYRQKENWEVNGEYEVDELSSAKPSEESEIVELSENDSDGHTLSIEPNNLATKEELSKFFTQEEIEELQDADRRENPEKKDVSDKSYSEMWDSIEEEHRKKVYQPQIREHYENKHENVIENNEEWMKESKYTESVKDLSGSEFLELMEEAQSDNVEELSEIPEELQEQMEKEIPDFEIEVNDEIDGELEEMAEEGFSERVEQGGPEYWDDIRKEIKMQRNAPDGTEISHTTNGERLRVKSKNEEMVSELRQKANDSRFSVEIERDTGDGLIATVDPGEFGG